MGSLAEMVIANPKTLLDGTVPYLGSRVSVDTPTFIAIVSCLVGTHLTVFVLAYVLGR